MSVELTGWREGGYWGHRRVKKGGVPNREIIAPFRKKINLTFYPNGEPSSSSK